MTNDRAVEQKCIAGRYAADLVRDGSVIGIGTGSTVIFAIERLAERIKEGLLISGVPTSHQARFRMQEYGIPLTSLEENPVLDLAIDGADQVDPGLRLIKGRGAAMVREKCVAAAAQEFIVVVDGGKMTSALSAPVPVEVIPFALGLAFLRVRDLGGNPILREGAGKDGPVISDNGNFILDCDFGAISDPENLEYDLERIPGVTGCGLFTGYSGKVRVIVADVQGCREIRLPPV